MIPESRRDGIMVENKRISPFFNAIPTGFGDNLDALFFYQNVIPTEFYDAKHVNILH